MTSDPYLEWLCHKVWITENKLNNYYRLARCLHMRAFSPVRNSLDQNRAMDGLQLRVIFMDKHGPVGSSVNRGPCTMLELLIALAERMSFEVEDDDHPHQTAHCFWEMIRNLGLASMNDIAWTSMNGEARTKSVLDRLINRTYMANGRGGLFPLQNPSADQRTVDLWYQMQSWLMEQDGDWSI